MADIQEGHPCRGMDCKDCETCRFDVELFPDGVQPNKKIKENMAEKRLCNNCVNLERIYEMRSGGRFDAACKVCLFEAFDQKRPRRIDFNVGANSDIVAPNWCPLIEGGKPFGLPSPSTVSSARPKPQETGPRPSTVPTPSPTGELTYTEKRERMKLLPKHLEWDDIKEGSTYLIPKIMSQSRKIVKVITKTDMCCSCHEISETTGNEYQYLCSVYPTDLDAVFITEIHNF